MDSDGLLVFFAMWVILMTAYLLWIMDPRLLLILYALVLTLPYIKWPDDE